MLESLKILKLLIIIYDTIKLKDFQNIRISKTGKLIQMFLQC